MTYQEAVKVVDRQLRRHTFYVPTKEEKKPLIRKYWWLNYDGVGVGRAPAGHLIPAGRCYVCKTHHNLLYTAIPSGHPSGGGIDVHPRCWSCWVSTNDD